MQPHCYYCGPIEFPPPFRNWHSSSVVPSISQCTNYYRPRLRFGKQNIALPPIPDKVDRQRLLLKGPHGREEVLRNNGFEVSCPMVIAAMQDGLDVEREEVREWASDRLRERMLEKALSLNMKFKGSRINKHHDIKKSWREDGSDENAKKMYAVMFGDYEEKNAAWSKTMEREFMESNDREYIADKRKGEQERSKKGCYEKIITKAKTNVVRLMNRDTRACIYMSLPQAEAVKIPQSERTKTRRKRGDFYIVDTVTVSAVSSLSVG
jgi:hypothetical protein